MNQPKAISGINQNGASSHQIQAPTISLPKGGGEASHGIYFVLEERVSEARFALDEFNGEALQNGAPVINKDKLSWGYIPSQSDEGMCIKEGEYINGQAPNCPIDGQEWDSSSAAVAWITLQKPVRIAIHASQMIPDE
jgi:hypothetical protein